MSTFLGQIQEIPLISIDNFENTNQKCYFLSHCHSDHLKGLKKLETNAPFYTTELSALIIRKRFPELTLNIQLLNAGFPVHIQFESEEGKEIHFIVTSLSAGHCMGACMLLFQIEGKDILYTGDFRISLQNTKNIKLLNEIKDYGNISLYLDSTFLSESFQEFPSQRESCLKVIEVVKKHLKLSSSNRVIIKTPAKYGYERLIIELSKHLKEQIFISETEVFEQYSFITDISDCITANKLKSRIYLRPDVSFQSAKNILTIQLSAMYWSNWKKGTTFVKETDSTHCRICFATHNSFSEIRDFVTYLKPKLINPNVVPEDFKEKQKMFLLIKQFEETICGNVLPTTTTKERGCKRKFEFKRLLSNDSDSKDSGRLFKKQKTL